MKRLHVHVSVENLDRSIAFYSAMFNAAPTVRKTDYAKWMLEDPRVNFAISTFGGRAAGLQHLGIQVESREELAEMRERLAAADLAVAIETGAACCYARSDKAWTTDPSAISWESFFTHGESTVYLDDGSERPADDARLAAAPEARPSTACRAPVPADEKPACCA